MAAHANATARATVYDFVGDFQRFRDILAVFVLDPSDP
jgi:hypothetical protein